ncbi:Disease resistance protein L6 [Linum perenne]
MFIFKEIKGSFGKLKDLQSLNLAAFWCNNLKEGLSDIGELPSLEFLYVSAELDGIKHLKSLKMLNTSSSICNLAELLELEDLTVVNCVHGLDIPLAEGEDDDDDDNVWWKVSKLKRLELWWTKIRRRRSTSGESKALLPSSLTDFCVEGGGLSFEKDEELVWLPSTLENLENLTRLSLHGCPNLVEIRGIKGLKSLESLELEEVSGLTNVAPLVRSLPKFPRLGVLKLDLEMSYIRGAVTAVVLVFLIILLYKLWYERRRSEDSNANNDNEHIIQLTDSTSVDDTSIVKLDSTNPSSSFSSPELTTSTLEVDAFFAEHDSPDLYSSFPSVEYEVFLSFRGPDTRRQITDILYRFLHRTKIHVFRDDNELRKGEEIGSNLRKAIDQSKIYVPIISKSYAHSKWCLIELAEIVQRHEQDTRRTILPIFYMMDPRDVRHQTGPYEDAFQEHGKKYDEKTIKNWKDALNKVGALKGWHVKNNDEQGAVADEVSADLLSRLSKENSTLETDELVGIDDHVEVVVEKLNLDSTNLTMVGLHGMGGIGKTTIAKAVYNKISSRFDRCCFLENIRETQDQKRGIVIIQEKLTSDILKMDSIRVSNDDEGRKMIKDRICRFKTLIILDDVDEKFKFEDVLGSPKNFHHGRGLPLTLKVIGSMLYREELAVWQEKLEQLRGTIEHQVMGRLPRFPSSLEILRLSCIEGHEIPELDIGDLKKLKVLYLNCSKLQNITGGTFGMLKGLQELDLTYFECKNLREVIVDVGELSSLKILRTKGAREVEYETPIGLKELSTSSRISNLAEMLELEVLKIYDCEFGLDIPPMWWKVSKLKNLRIIQTNINGGGSSSNNNMITTTMLPSSLTSLQIYHCHAWLPSLVNLGNLTLLLMVDCQTICNHLDGIEGLTSLKKLRIQEVKGLARITGLTNLLSLPDCKLEQLAIFNCPDLIELHDDDKAAEVGVVVNSLRSMDIINCPQLDIGPLVRGLTKFPMLEVVWLENIKFTEHQLEGVGSLEELEYCFLKLPSLERITPLSKLKKLKQLTIAGAHGLREIEGLGELKCLEYLILPNCTSLERLWQADDRLENLKKLDIRNCRSLSVEHLSALETEMSYIRGVVMAVVLVFPVIQLYKLWYERRRSEDSNTNNDNEYIIQLTDSTYVDDTSIVKLDSTNPSSSFSSPWLTNSTLEVDASFAEHDSPDPYSSFPSVEYEVFLSFRGPDTRRQITDILYRFLRRTKIHAFRDDNELRKGEEIGSNLRKAIDQSKIYVPIISKSYAHSKWCLIELAEIIQRHEQDTRRIILPIFYMVDPKDVRNQIGPYEDAFQEHGKKYDEKTIKNWKDALNKVGKLKGWHVKNNDEQGAVADEVSADLLSRLSKENSTLETDELVGIDDHVEVVVEKLNLDSTNLTMVGLHGMGGIGKTTIAKAVYNKISSRFDRCCFLENIRETQDQKRGIVIIQEKLTSDFLRMDSIRVSNDDEGRRMIKDRICRFKTLIILDDVDEKFKFEDVLGSPKNFHQGSRFIITSRNIKVLGSLNENQCRLYEVGAMSQSRSLELFCKHAFKKNYPPPNYNTLVEGIVSTTGGLPLTLKVIGSMLYREELAVWQEKLEQLRGTIEHQVMERLKISYDTLTNEAQQIFLDIACFFIGENKEMPSYMWSDCKFYPASNINILIQRSMIKLGDKDVFQMHDQLRDMGREIVRQENIEHPWMRSRIWSAEEGKKLIYERKMAERLKLIDLSYCSGFRKLPRFPRSLEILRLGHITLHEIQELDIGDLKKLKVLHLNYSKVQKITGGTFGMLKGLQELDLSNFKCKNLREVMVDVGELSSLKILRTKGSREVEYETPIGLKELSTSSRISNLAEMLELEVLIIDDCKFGLDIPPMWWKVSKLKYLSVVKTYINGGGGSSNNNMITTMLPSSLTYLHINQCHAWLPSLVNLGNLTDLEMVGCQTLCNHLDGIERMTSLKNLLIYGVKGLARIIGLTDLLFSPNCKLENVIIVKCPDLIELHDDKAAEAVVVVNSLRMMNIVHCPQLDVGPLVRGLTTFPMLWVLCLENIKFTEHQLEGVGSLKELECCILKLPSLERITPLSKLQKLKELTIAGAHGLREIKGLRELKSLEYLILPNCTSLERLWHADDRMENLKKLDIRNCRSLSVEHLSALEAGLPPNVEISWPDEPYEDDEIDSLDFCFS